MIGHGAINAPAAQRFPIFGLGLLPAAEMRRANSRVAGGGTGSTSPHTTFNHP